MTRNKPGILQPWIGRGLLFFILIFITTGAISCSYTPDINLLATFAEKVTVQWIYTPSITPSATFTPSQTAIPTPTFTPLPTATLAPHSLTFVRTIIAESKLHGQMLISFFPNTDDYYRVLIQGAHLVNMITNGQVIIDLESNDISYSSNLPSPDGLVEALFNQHQSLRPTLSITKINGSPIITLEGETGCFLERVDYKQSCYLFPEAFSPDGSLLITTAEYGGGPVALGVSYPFQVWEIKSGTLLGEGIDSMGYANAVFNPNGKSFIIESVEGPFFSLYKQGPMWEFYEVQPFALRWTKSMPIKQYAIARFSPDGRMIAISSDNVNIDIINPEDGTDLLTINVNEGVAGFAFSPEVNYIYALLGGDLEGNSIGVYDVRTGKPIRSFDLPFTTYNGIAFSPDGKYLFMTRYIIVSSRLGIARIFVDIYAVSP